MNQNICELDTMMFFDAALESQRAQLLTVMADAISECRTAADQSAGLNEDGEAGLLRLPKRPLSRQKTVSFPDLQCNFCALEKKLFPVTLQAVPLIFSEPENDLFPSVYPDIHFHF